jgi:hypothetical protein
MKIQVDVPDDLLSGEAKTLINSLQKENKTLETKNKKLIEENQHYKKKLQKFHQETIPDLQSALNKVGVWIDDWDYDDRSKNY